MITQADIIKAIAEHLSVSPQDLDKNASLRQDLNLGPIELEDLLSELSLQFDIVFEREDIASLQTVEDLIAMVEDNSL